MNKLSILAIAALLATLPMIMATSALAQTSTTTTTTGTHHFHHFFGGGVGLGGFGFGFHTFAHPFLFGNQLFSSYQEVQPQSEQGSVIVQCPQGSVLADNQCVVPKQVITQEVAPSATVLTQSGEQDAGSVFASGASSVVVPQAQACSTGTITTPIIVSTGNVGGLFGGFDNFGGFHHGNFHDGDHVTKSTTTTTTTPTTTTPAS
jgi:hypothetical protein